MCPSSLSVLSGPSPARLRRPVQADQPLAFWAVRPLPTKKEPSRVLACGRTSVLRIQGREKALAVPPWLTAAPARRAAVATPKRTPPARARLEAVRSFRPVTGAARRILLAVSPNRRRNAPSRGTPNDRFRRPRSNAQLGRESSRLLPGSFQPVAPVSAGSRVARRCLRHRM